MAGLGKKVGPSEKANPEGAPWERCGNRMRSTLVTRQNNYSGVIQMDKVKMGELLQKAINPDSAPLALIELKELIEADNTAIQGYQNELKKNAEQIAELQKTNLQLYTRVGVGKVEGTEEPEQTESDYDIFVKELCKNGEH